jgi:hypothetical protein
VRPFGSLIAAPVSQEACGAKGLRLRAARLGRLVAGTHCFLTGYPLHAMHFRSRIQGPSWSVLGLRSAGGTSQQAWWRRPLASLEQANSWRKFHHGTRDLRSPDYLLWLFSYTLSICAYLTGWYVLRQDVDEASSILGTTSVQGSIISK